MGLDQVMYLSFKDIMGAGLVIGAGMLIILFVLLIALLVFYSRKRYYQRIRLGSPRLDKPAEKRRSASFKKVLRAILIISLIVLACLLLFCLIKWGMGLLAASNAANESSEMNASSQEVAEELEYEPSAEEEGSGTEEIAIEETQEPISNSSGPELNQTAATSSFATGVGGFIMTYAGYVIVGFVILIILIAVLGARKQDQNTNNE